MGWEPLPEHQLGARGLAGSSEGLAACPGHAQSSTEPARLRAQEKPPARSPSAAADASSCSARISLASRVRYWQRRSSCCSTVAMRRERVCRQPITDGSAWACRAPREDTQHRSDRQRALSGCPVPAMSPSPSNAGRLTVPGGHGAAAHTAAQTALWGPQWGGTGTQALLTSERGCRTQGPRPARPGTRGMFRNALRASRNSPVTQRKAQTPPPRAGGTQGHRLPSEEEQGLLPLPSAHASSAQSKPTEQSPGGVYSLQGAAGESSVAQAHRQQRGHSVRRERGPRLSGDPRPQRERSSRGLAASPAGPARPSAPLC